MTARLISPCIAVALVFTSSFASTWSVRKDGTGDFLVIQDAIDTAADGDTISIGPGRFADFTFAIPGGWSVARVEDKSLTFVGAGADQTILGPETFGDVDDNDVYCVLIYGEDLTTRIRHIGFENVVYWCVRVQGEGRAEIDECVFRNSSGGFYGLLRDGGWIRNCVFEDMNTIYQYVNVLLYTPSVDVTIEGCVFENCTKAVGSYWGGCEDIAIQECLFLGGEIGVGFTDGASGSVVECEFSGQSRYGIVGNSPGTIRIERNVIDQTGADSYCFCAFAPPGNYVLRDNMFSGDVKLMGIFDPRIDWDCRDNHFLRTGPEALYIRPANTTNYHGPPIYLDFTENWWGTDDPDVVSTWIYDGYDDPEHHFFVDFEPMAGGSVRVESRTWSDVKSLFRVDGQ